MEQPRTQGQRIRQLRQEKRYTQEYLAGQLGTTKQTIYKYENDIVKTIPKPRLKKLAALLGCSAAWLQGLEDAPAAPQPAGLHEGDPFALYRALMDILPALSAEEQRSVLAYARFLQAQHTAP